MMEQGGLCGESEAGVVFEFCFIFRISSYPTYFLVLSSRLRSSYDLMPGAILHFSVDVLP
jgi:hypothetical protein